MGDVGEIAAAVDALWKLHFGNVMLFLTKDPIMTTVTLLSLGNEPA